MEMSLRWFHFVTRTDRMGVREKERGCGRSLGEMDAMHKVGHRNHR